MHSPGQHFNIQPLLWTSTIFSTYRSSCLMSQSSGPRLVGVFNLLFLTYTTWCRTLTVLILLQLQPVYNPGFETITFLMVNCLSLIMLLSLSFIVETCQAGRERRT